MIVASSILKCLSDTNVVIFDRARAEVNVSFGL